MGADADGIYISASYLTTIDSPANKNFLAAMQEKFGADLKTPNDLSVPQYEAIYAYKLAVEKAGSMEPKAIIEALAEVAVDGPRGRIQMNKQRHAPLTMYLGQVEADGSVRVIQTFKDVDPGDAVPEPRPEATAGAGRRAPPGPTAMIALLLDIVDHRVLLFLVAGGLLVIFGVMKIINFAHGALVTVGAYAGAGRDPARALALAGPAARLRRRRRDRHGHREAGRAAPLYARPLDAILATWGLGIVIGQVITLVFGREVQFVTAPVSGTVERAGRELLRLSPAAGRGGCGRSALGFAALLGRTRLGLTARAVIMNEILARGARHRHGAGALRHLRPGLAGSPALAGALITPLPASTRTWACPGWSTPSCW